jgi:hypothetical protein
MRGNQGERAAFVLHGEGPCELRYSLVANHGGISPGTITRVFAFYDRHKSADAPACG